MSKDQDLTSKKIVENVEIVEALLCSYKVILENNNIINSETKKYEKMCNIFPFNLEYKIIQHILKDSELD